MNGNASVTSRFGLLQGILPIQGKQTLKDSVAGFQLTAMNIPQALGYTRIAGTPIVTGFYTLLLPLLTFAALGSSRYLVVAADSATLLFLPAGCHAWRQLPARITWRWRAWWHCSLPASCYLLALSNWASSQTSSRRPCWLGFLRES